MHNSVEALQSRLVGALIGLARATDGNAHLISEASTSVVIESLTAENSVTILEGLLRRVKEEKRNMVPDCFTCASPCGRNNDYDLRELEKEPERIRSLKNLLLAGIREMAADYRRTPETDSFFYKALIAVGMEGWSPEGLEAIILEMETMKPGCGGMA